MKEQILAFVSSSKFSAPVMTLDSTGMQKQGLQCIVVPKNMTLANRRKVE